MAEPDVIDAIFSTFARRGSAAYLGEEVSLTEHMLQTAMAAEQDGAEPILVASALLHDYGHLVHELPGTQPSTASTASTRRPALPGSSAISCAV
jgi:predicted HD phosphohydrolase